MIGNVGNGAGRRARVPLGDEVVHDAQVADHHEQRRCEPQTGRHERVDLTASPGVAQNRMKTTAAAMNGAVAPARCSAAWPPTS